MASRRIAADKDDRLISGFSLFTNTRRTNLNRLPRTTNRQNMTHFKLAGYCMLLGGALLILGNALFSPLLPLEGAASDAVGSNAFVWRLGTNAATVFLLMIGTTGVYRYQAEQSGAFGAAAFGIVFCGCAFMFAHEWGQVFFMHSLAAANPEAFNALDGSSPTMFLIELGLSLGGFTLGWIIFSISVLTAKALPRRGPILVLSGFVAIPILSAVLSSPVWGGILGSIPLGGGLMLMGMPLLADRS